MCNGTAEITLAHNNGSSVVGVSTAGIKAAFLTVI
jgi:hypothetical protein